jgi:hypothetical protein
VSREVSTLYAVFLKEISQSLHPTPAEVKLPCATVKSRLGQGRADFSASYFDRTCWETQKVWGHGSSGREPTWQLQGPKFKPHYPSSPPHKKKVVKSRNLRQLSRQRHKLSEQKGCHFYQKKPIFCDSQL